MKYKEINEAVLYNIEDICTLDKADLLTLAEKGLATREQRTRLCVHESPDSRVHEMFIVHTPQTYVRPHRHMQKSESFEVLSGEATLVLFDDAGVVQRIVELGELNSGKVFYFKMPAQVWHMLVIHSDVLVFKEVTEGPFDKDDCQFPDWAPAGRHCDEVPEYMTYIGNQLALTGTDA